MGDYSDISAVFPLKTYAITDVDTGTEQFVIDGDQTERFQDGDEFSVVDSTGNDGAYTVASTSYSEIGDETTITVNEDITDATVDGTIVHREVADSLPITEAHDDASDRDAAAPEEYAGAHAQRLANELRALGKTAGEVLGLEVVDGGGLIIYYTGAKVLKGSGTPVFVPPGTLTLTDNDDNYVEVNVAGTVSSNVVGFTTGKYPLAIVTTLAGVLTAIVDARSAIYLAEFAEANLDDFGPSFNGGTELTISGGVITRTQGVHLVDTEGDAPTDNLDTINGGVADMMLFVRAAHTDRTVVLRDGIGNLELAGSNITLDDIDQFVLLLYDGTLSKWVVVGGAGGGVTQLSGLSDVSAVLYTAGFVLRADGAGFVAARLAHTDLGSVTSSQHHARYADGEAVSAMGAKADGNPLNHDRYTDAEAIAAVDLTPYLKKDGSVDVENFVYDTAVELTIAAGVVTRTKAVHKIDTESDDPTDDLVTISGGADGMIVIVRAENAARTVVLKETGNLALGGSDITLDDINKMVMLYYEGAVSKWLLIGGADGGGIGDMLKSVYDTGNDGIVDNSQALQETGGPTKLVMAGVADNTFLKRSGTTIIGSTPAGAGDMTKAVYDTGDDGIVDSSQGLRETGGPTSLAMGAVTDGQFLKRVGAAVVGAAGTGGGAAWRFIDIAAGAWDYPQANPAPLDTDIGTNGTIKRQLFDDTTEEFIIAQIRLPSDLDSGGTVNFELYGYAVAAAASKNVEFTIYHSAKNDGENWDAAFASKVSGDLATDSTQDQLDSFSWNETVATLGWAADDLVRIKLGRTAPSVNNLVGDYGLTHFRLKIPRA